MEPAVCTTDGLNVPAVTLRGKWMYPTAAVTPMTGRVRGGSLDLGHFDVRGFALDVANGAVAHAAEHAAVQDDGDRGLAFARAAREPPSRRVGAGAG